MSGICAKIVILSLLGITCWAKPYRGGELRTIQTYRYGRFEVRMQSAPESGVVSSLFTFHEFGSAGIEDWNEIDIEFLGRYDDEVQYNVITDWQVNHEHRQALDFNPATEFHDYAFEWTPDYVAWFVDGVELYRQSGLHIQDLQRSQKMMMNIWQPDYPDWAGAFDPASLPVYAIYDWARYCYYVPGTGNTGTDNNFIEFWRDDFDSWDTNRWQKATHTWDGNNVDFIPANVVYQDGFMILCMTMPDALGYDGPPLGAAPNGAPAPTDFQLYPAYPNPFNGFIHIPYYLSRTGKVQLEVSNLSGQKVYTTAIPSATAGVGSFQWIARSHRNRELASGPYFLMLSSGETTLNQTILLVK